jgi:hypothetical protein
MSSSRITGFCYFIFFVICQPPEEPKHEQLREAAMDVRIAAHCVAVV